MNVKPQGASEPSQPWYARAPLPVLLCGVFCIAFSPIFVRLSEVGPIATAVNRMVLPLPFFFGWMLLSPTRRLPLTHDQGKRDLMALLLAGFFFAGDLAAWHWSIKLTSVANSTVLANLSPVFVVIAAWVLFHEKVSKVFVCGLGLALVGVGVLMAESLTVSAKTLLGDALGVSTAFFYSGYLLTVARIRKRASTAATMGWAGLAASIILYALAWLWEGNVWPDTMRGWLVAIGLAIVTQIGGQTLIALSLAHVPAGFGAMMLLLQPIIATFMAWALFREPVSLWQYAGGAAILMGLEVARRGAAKSR